jgi:hypothetical protein
MAPEGLIVHQATGRRFYVIHYGGDDLNKFIVLDYNGATGNFDGALEVDSEVSSLIVSLRDISRDDPRQQWVVDFTANYSTKGSKRTFVLSNVYNGRVLYLGLEPLLGESLFSTLDIANIGDPYTKLNMQILGKSITFSFVPAVGVHMNVVDNGTTQQMHNFSEKTQGKIDAIFSGVDK